MNERIENYKKYEKMAASIDREVRRISVKLRKSIAMPLTKIYEITRHCAVYGNCFIDLDKMRMNVLPPETVYCIMTTEGDVLEVQQSKDGPDYTDIGTFAMDNLAKSSAIRFKPAQIANIAIPPIKNGYGTSVFANDSAGVLDEFFEMVLAEGLVEASAKGMKWQGDNFARRR
jgi:hypothetical protein